MSLEGSIDGLDAAIANDEEDEDADAFVGKKEAPLEHEDDEEEGKVVVGLVEEGAPCCWRFDEEDPPSNDGRLFV